MIISSIHLRQFRNHHNSEFKLDPKVTIITGKNGAGKTNILEAIYVAATGKSFRDPDESLTEHTKDWWRIEADTENEHRDVRYKDAQKTILINDKSFKRLGTAHTLPVVLFEPDHLQLVHGSPQSRRKYIDTIISTITPGYATLIRRYERVIAQRNRLLKSPHLDHDQLFVWDVALGELATKIVEQRLQYITRWNNSLSEHYQDISEKTDEIMVGYSEVVVVAHYTQKLLTKLRDSFDRDRMIGSTSHGPHRDDYTFYMNKKDMVHTASRGEIRTLLLALKYHEATQLEIMHKSSPLFLFDDVFSELDETRQSSIINKQSSHQIVITTTHVTQPNSQVAKVITL